MKQYEVGQILYMTGDKSFKIIPVQVIEEVVRTTIDGKEKTYMIMFPDKEKTIVDINKIAGKLFKDENSIQSYMIENTKKAINKLIREANLLKSSVFATNKQHTSKLPSVVVKEDIMQPNDDDDIILKVDLGNGQVGRINQNNLK